MANELSILILHGDAELRLLADAELAVQAVFPDAVVNVTRAWTTRPRWMESPALPLPEPLSEVLPVPGVADLLARPHALVVVSLLPATTVPAFVHRSGGGFLAHPGARDDWSPEVHAMVAAECTEQPPLSPAAAAAEMEPIIEALQARGTAVALCTTFRHVRAPLAHRSLPGPAPLRELIRGVNLEVARLSQRTGCYVLDLDRPLAQEGGATLDADYRGGDGRAAEIALDEFAALVLDVLPPDFGSSEVA